MGCFNDDITMKLLIKLLLAVMLVLISLYYISRYLLPSVTLINHSGLPLSEVKVSLPDSNLNFGAINPAGKNTIHYSLSQSDGEYRYQMTYSDSQTFSGSCGYLTNNEIHKRVTIIVYQGNKVVCQ